MPDRYTIATIWMYDSNETISNDTAHGWLWDTYWWSRNINSGF